MAVPRARGVARGALTARIPHPEAVGLLAEAMTGERVVLVLDELERLRDEPEAWTVIEALLRHAPADMRFVLCQPATPCPRRFFPGIRVTSPGSETMSWR